MNGHMCPRAFHLTRIKLDRCDVVVYSLMIPNCILKKEKYKSFALLIEIMKRFMEYSTIYIYYVNRAVPDLFVIFIVISKFRVLFFSFSFLFSLLFLSFYSFIFLFFFILISNKKLYLERKSVSFCFTIYK